jgi:membrane protein YdbS with pleckstrin-like domain
MHGAPIPPEIARLERPREQLLTWYFLKALATVFVFPVSMLLFYFRYHTMRYKFDEDGIHLSWGILMRHEIMLNYSRIQDIQLHSNVIERWLGLTRIEVQTAAGAADSEMTLEGLPNPEAMRDFLYSRMRGAHTPSPTVGPAAANAAREPLEAVLLEIASELRSIREVLEARKA